MIGVEINDWIVTGLFGALVNRVRLSKIQALFPFQHDTSRSTGSNFDKSVNYLDLN